MSEIDPDLLEDLLENDRDMVDEAIQLIHVGQDVPMSLLMIEMGNRRSEQGRELHEAVMAYLAEFELTDTFIGTLRRLGCEVATEESRPGPFDRIDTQSFDPDGLERFARASSAYRCRVMVNGEIKGSGVLVSHRLVLTSWHVVNRKQGWSTAQPPRIEILTSDNQTLRASLAGPYSECHPREWDELPTETSELNGYFDFVLLQLFKPIGFSLGYLALPDQTVAWDGNVDCMLVHYPNGQDRGLTRGTVSYGGDAFRYQHTVPTLPGSSGGTIFSNGLEPVGLHQGTIGDRRHLVPLARFANDNEFLVALGADRNPTYLWSIDRSLDSHLVIGRQGFFDALDQMVDDDENLRGIWIRRLDPTISEAGLGFPYQLLKAFLALRDPGAELARVELPVADEDLFEKIEAQMATVQGSARARAGVREDETTTVAFESDRADALVRRIEAHSPGQTWIYLDGPEAELSRNARNQVEQLVARLGRSKKIRFILTRLESYTLPIRTFQSLADVAQENLPGVLMDYVGDFARTDVLDTIRAINEDFNLGLEEAVIEFVADNALNGIESTFGRYPTEKLREVSGRIVEDLKPRIEAA